MMETQRGWLQQNRELRRRRQRRYLATVATLLAVTAVAGAAGAETFVLTAVADAVDAMPGDGICATAAGACTLRAAIQEANALEGEDVVVVPVMPAPSRYELTLSGDNEDAAATGDLDITDDLIVQGRGGGSITIDSTPTDRVFDVLPGVGATLANFMIQEGNVGPANGGCIRNRGILIARQLTVRSCAAANGGAIANLDSAFLSLTNVTLSGNSATDQGGGLFNINQSTAQMLNVTIVNNTAGAGGGIFNLVQANAQRPTPLLVQNTLLSNVDGGDCAGAPLQSAGNNLETLFTCLLNGPNDISLVNPAIGPLVNNGGHSSTHALLANSPAVDAGSATTCPDLDQRDFLRPADGNSDGSSICDIGAYELAAVAPTRTPTFSPTPTATPTLTGTLPPSETPTETGTPTLTETETPTPTISPTVSQTPTQSQTPTLSATPTQSLTPSLTATITPTPLVSFTPTPSPSATATSTPTRTVTPTSTPSRSATPAASPTATATRQPPAVEIGAAEGSPGDTVRFDVVLRTGGFEVSSVNNEIAFDALNTPIAALGNGTPDCLGPAELVGVFRFRPQGCMGSACTGIFASALQLVPPVLPIPDGTVLYSCAVNIAATAPTAAYPLTTSPTSLVVADLDGLRINEAIGVDGAIDVVEVPCLGDCNGDGAVTVDEIVRLVNIALGLATLDTCPAGDGNGDGRITVDEIVTAVANALNGCPEG